MFAAKTVSLRWTGTPADKTGCKLSFQLESKALPKTLKVSDKTTNSKALSGKKDVLIKYGDGKVTVKTDCATWSLKVVPTGHPGVAIKRATDATRTKATDAAGLNEALAESHVDWWLSTNYTYPRNQQAERRLEAGHHGPRLPSCPSGRRPTAH